MTIDEIITTYLKGWELGDGGLSLGVTVDAFYYDDPNTGRIVRADFVAFVNDFKQAAVEMGASVNAYPFLEYSDIVIRKENDTATIWCWWHAVGTELQGSALVKASQAGILNEKIAYFSRLPDSV
ncbi:MAG: hypothetical protein ACI8P9_001284 [Parasphingorhabdus sp.]|jgi:hypothetical protein